MKIHHVPQFAPDRVVVVQNTVVVADGRLDDLRFTDDGDGSHDFIEVFLHPSAVPAFKDRFFPAILAASNGNNRRSN